jgi:prepilin-type N-terminal cleavage/methylation domain-containing protein
MNKYGMRHGGSHRRALQSKGSGRVSRLPPGFSLTELLVTIACIAILAALLVPALAKAKLNAQKIKCVSNLKQLAAEAFMYRQDYKGAIAYAGPSNVWLQTLDVNLAQSGDLRLCPVASTPVSLASAGPGTAANCVAWGGTNQSNWVSYTINGWLYDPNSDSPPMQYVPDTPSGSYFKTYSAIMQPLLTPEFGDGNWADCWPNNNRSLTDSSSAPHGSGTVNLFTGDNNLSYPAARGNAPIGRYLIARHGGFPPGNAPRGRANFNSAAWRHQLELYRRPCGNRQAFQSLELPLERNQRAAKPAAEIMCSFILAGNFPDYGVVTAR